MIYTIEKIATLIGARRYGDCESTVGWLLTDSRSLCFPEQTLFFALRTRTGDGHRYIGDLFRRGVRSFVVEQVPENYATLYPNANFLRVPSPLAALQRLAERHRDEFDIPVVGITGSNGKTWVKEWLYQLLMPSQSITRSPRSYNSQIGVPLSVWLLNENSRIGLFEAGISEPGEMLALHDIIQPTLGVLTSLGQAHQENFRSLEEKCMEKLQLFHDAGAIVYPSDDDVVSRCIRRSGYPGERIGWSRFDRNAAMYVVGTGIIGANASERLNKGHDGVPTLGGAGSYERMGVTVSYIYKGIEGEYTLPFIDEASIANSITCAATALTLGLTPADLQQRMPLLEPIAMRMEVKEGVRGLTLINDSYNSDLQSLDIALDFMCRRAIGANASERLNSGIGANASERLKTLILSDILQSGETAAELYSQVGDLVEKRGVDVFVGIGPELSAHADKIRCKEKWTFPDVGHFLDSELFNSLHDSVVLLKGARRFGFEQISERMEQRVHETILEVDLSALAANLNYFRSLLKPETRMVCMIKADAYGAGAIEVARTLQDLRVDYLAVAVADEGAALRRAGITQNIIVMNPEMTSFKTLFDFRLEPEVYSFRLLDALIHAARQQGIAGWPVHIKIDTGMHRLGFEPKEMDKLVERLTHQSALLPRSVFTHFVGADSDQFNEFSKLQFSLFDEATHKLQKAFSHKILRHIDNSAGIEHFPERQLDMCRLGIGLYGVGPYHKTSNLETVSTLKTTILQLRHVKKGDTVGYSRKGTLERDSIIGAIPIGYADGLNRHLGNRAGYCIVNGYKAEYVGNICMDVALIDVTDIPCKEGDMVEIFGRDLPVTTLSDTLGTIPYEVLTAVSNRVKRVYFQD